MAAILSKGGCVKFTIAIGVVIIIVIHMTSWQENTLHIIDGHPQPTSHPTHTKM